MDTGRTDGERTTSASWYEDPHDDGPRYRDSARTEQGAPGRTPATPAEDPEDRSRLGRILAGVLGACLALFSLAVLVVAVREWDGSLVVLILNLVLPAAFAAGAFASFRSAFRS